MPIIVNFDVMLAQCKTRSKNLAARIGITEAKLSLLKQGRVKGVRFEILAAICAALQCQPGDLLEFRPGTRTTSVEPATRHACRACSSARAAP